MKGLNKKCKEVFKGNQDRGFWEEGVENRNKSELIMLVVTELAEAVEALRENRKADLYDFYDTENGLIRNSEPKAFQVAFEQEIKDTYEDELADAFIRLMDMCGALDIDIEKHIELKLEYNAIRERKHGKLF